MDKNQSERWDVKFWLKWRYGIEKSNCWDGRLIKITNNWYSKDSKIRLKCENVEVNWNPTPKTEIQKELSLRTEIYQYSFNFHSRMLRFENMWICIWCRNLQAKSGTRNNFLLSFLSKHSYIPIQLKKMFQNQTWPVQCMSKPNTRDMNRTLQNDVPNQYLKSILRPIKKINIFSENVIFQLILKKSIKRGQININKKSILRVNLRSPGWFKNRKQNYQESNISSVLHLFWNFVCTKKIKNWIYITSKIRVFFFSNKGLFFLQIRVFFLANKGLFFWWKSLL